MNRKNDVQNLFFTPNEELDEMERKILELLEYQYDISLTNN